MNKVDSFRVLMAVEFGRTEVCEGVTPCRIVYTFRKATPFGVLEATDNVDIFTFNKEGAMKTDARMLRVLSERINREEIDLLTEMAANVDFGERRSAAAV